MARDFASQSYNGKKKQTRQKPYVLIIVSIFAVMVTVYYVVQNKKVATTAVETATNTPEATKPQVSKPRFEFYQRLPDNEQLAGPSDERYQEGPYFLYVADLKYLAEAKRLIVKLTAHNLSANMMEEHIDGKKVYRVYLGPFANNIDARRTQEAMTKANYRTRLAKVKSPS